MALTASRQYETVGPTVRLAGKAEASDVYYKGGLLVHNSSGYIAVPGGAATDIPAGVFTGFGIPVGSKALTVEAATHPDIEVERGLVWVPFSGAEISDVGELFYLADDETLTQTIGSNLYGLMCVGFKTGYVLVDFGNLIKAA